jgi:hypothetical protein
MGLRASGSPVLLVVCSLTVSPLCAAGPARKEGATVKVAEHTYVIPDFNVGLVRMSARRRQPRGRW